MGILFSGPEVVTMAVEIEKNGMNFYRAMAAKTTNEKAKMLFRSLADEEVRHKVMFEKMLGGVKMVELTATEEEDYNNYLGALTSSRVFKKDANIDDLARNIDDVAAIDMAIDAEKNAILFYYEIMDQAIDEDQRDIEKVIREEKSHYAKLVALKGQLTN